jgi:hypothetical protein
MPSKVYVAGAELEALERITESYVCARRTKITVTQNTCSCTATCRRCEKEKFAM